MTHVFTDRQGQTYLLPTWTLEHAGFSPTDQASGHVDPKATSGSVFRPGLDPIALVQGLLDDPQAERAGVMLQTHAAAAIGWSALITGTEGATAWTGVILKQEAPVGSKMPTTVVAPAIVSPTFGEADSQTTTYSMIAPPTTDVAFLDEDVKANPQVLAALQAGRLRTIVSLFPGPAIVDGVEIPKISQWQAGSAVGFVSVPENALYVPLDLSPTAIETLVERWNVRAMQDLSPVDVAHDKAMMQGWAAALRTVTPRIEVPPLAEVGMRLDAQAAKTPLGPITAPSASRSPTPPTP